MSGVAERLPEGFEVRIRDDVLRLDSGSVLIGGSPLRVLRLRPTAAGLVRAAPVRVNDVRSGRLATRLLDGNLADPLVDGPGGRHVDASELTVVIPVRDRAAQLDRALAGLAPLGCVVVDDASADPVPVAEVAHRHRARVVRLERNLGPAAARNAGLATVSTPFVAFVDSDVEATSAMLLRLCRHFCDRRVGLVAPRVRGRSRSPRPRWFERYDEQRSSLDLGDRACSVRPGAVVGWLPGACLVGRVDLLGEGFDAGLRVGEDVDLVWRLVAAGVTVRYEPAEVALHDARSRLGEWLARKYCYGTSAAPLAARHGHNGAPAVLSPPMALAATALLLRGRRSTAVAAACCCYGAARLSAEVPALRGRPLTSARLVARGLGWALRQESALALRHWSPPVLACAVFSPRLRRVLVSSLLVDLACSPRGDAPPGRDPAGIDPVRTWIGRRLDDLAYGAGLWTGAIRAGSLGCLTVRWTRRTRTTGRSFASGAGSPDPSARQHPQHNTQEAT